MAKLRYKKSKFSVNTKQLLPLLLIFILLILVIGLSNINKIRTIFKSRASEVGTGLKAFSDAEGFGAVPFNGRAAAVGGRGGRVIQVTNLNDSGTGSLRECLTASGARICVFTTGGTIELASSIEITNPYITIAGQTATGDGITVKATENVRNNPTQSGNDVHIKIKTHDVIFRYLHLRPGTKGSNARALSINGPSGGQAYNVIIDHNSLSWAGDEILISWDDTQYVTFSWNNFSESLDNDPIDSVGLKGPNLGKETGGFYSFHHNLVAHHAQRLPNISTGAGPTDVVNNVMYNAGGTGTRILLGANVNLISNYIKAGPNTTLNTWFQDDGAGGFYLGGDNSNTSNSNAIVGKSINLLPASSINKIKTRFDAPPITTMTAQETYDKVLNNAGAVHGLNCDGSWFDRKDSVDIRIIQSVREGTRGHNESVSSTFQQRGYISSPEQVGGWPYLAPGTPCNDSDRDGMPDEWENSNFGNLDRGNTNNSTGDFDTDGYTDLEEYLNGTDPIVNDTGVINPVTKIPTPTQNIVSSTPNPTSFISATPTTTRLPSPTKSYTPTPRITSAQMTTNLYPIADTFVKKSSPERNFGDANKLEVDDNPSTISYLKFNLNSLENKTIQSAKLRLRITNTSSDAQRIRIAENTGWNENKMTYNNRPLGTSNYKTINGGKSGEWVEVDITSFVKQKQGKRISLMIDTAGSNGLDFYSREYSSYTPTLVVSYY